MSLFHRRWYGLWMGLLLAAVLLAVNIFLEKLLHIPMLPFVLFDWLTTTLPGGIVTFGLDRTIDLVRFLNTGQTSDVAKLAERLLALVIFAAVGGLLGWLLGGLRGQRAAWGLIGVAAILPSVGLMVWFENEEGWKLLNVVWGVMAWLAWGKFTLRWLAHLESLPEKIGEPSPSGSLMTRRLFMTHLSIQMGAVVLVTGTLRYALNAVIPENARAGIALAGGKLGELFPSRQESSFITAARTRPEITPMSEFYKVDKNLLPPNVQADEWQLVIDGLVETPLIFTYEEILAMDAVEFPATLMCISNDVGGDLIGTTWFRGVPLRGLLEQAKLKPEVRAIQFYAADGFYETIPLMYALWDETILCYGMDGKSLTVPHGFPLRVYIPGRYGMKQPKWLQRIEAVAQGEEGYWGERGWSQDAFIQMTTIIDPIDEKLENGILRVGGIAFSGDRGISKVEVRVEDGEWIEAELRDPLSPLTWVQWRADIPLDKKDGQRIWARCVDGQGREQIAEYSGSRPDGATGHHARKV